MADLLNVQGLGEWIDTAQSSLFRLETLDMYNVESDGGDYQRYVRGEPGPDMDRKALWMNELSARTARGLRHYRVHALRTPLGDYLRYECEWGYAYNVTAGEEIGILDLAEKPRPEGLIDEDFWLKDDAEVLSMHYAEDGSFLGGEVMPPAALTRYREARDAALAAADPFESWWASHPEYHRDR